MNINSQSTNFCSNVIPYRSATKNNMKITTSSNDEMENLKKYFHDTFGKNPPESMEDALILTGVTFDDDNSEVIVYPAAHYFKRNPINY